MNAMAGTSIQSSLWSDTKPPTPVTLPIVKFKNIDIERERKETAARLIETRAIKAGADAWQEIGKAESFEAWKRIGVALSIGKAHALKVSGANAAWGRNYSRAFNEWLKQHHFDNMRPSVRSVAIELHENIAAIEPWRNADKGRRKLIHPLSVTRRWKLSVAHGEAKTPQDLKRDAVAAWRKFVACVEALPADKVAPLWQVAQAQAMKASLAMDLGMALLAKRY
jgi:hypothetical protein